MGVLFGYQGRYGAALSAQEDAVKTLRELKETGFWRTQVLINYGAALGEIGKSDDARKNLDEALSYAREMKNNTQVAQALREEGDSFYYQARPNSRRLCTRRLYRLPPEQRIAPFAYGRNSARSSRCQAGRHSVCGGCVAHALWRDRRTRLKISFSRMCLYFR